jgi:hypothetical protein
MISCDLYCPPAFPFPFFKSTTGDFLGDVELDVDRFDFLALAEFGCD